MWYPEWFGSFGNWMLSATCGLVFSCLLALVRIYESLRRVEKHLDQWRDERREHEVDEDGGDGER